jgi:hypothetical protein
MPRSGKYLYPLYHPAVSWRTPLTRVNSDTESRASVVFVGPFVDSSTEFIDSLFTSESVEGREEVW